MIYGISSTIGAGIFALTGLAASYTGPSVCVSFLLAGIVAIFTGLSFAELSGRVPFSGSAYSYAYISFGEFPAWLIGWNQTLRYGLCGAALSRAWAEYIIGLLEAFGISNIPEWTHHLHLGGAFYASPLAAVFVILSHYIITRGSKESLYFTNILTIGKLGFVFVIMICGVFYVDKTNWKPFLTHGMGGLVTGASIVFFGYLGFDAVTTVAEESINPKQDIPRAVLWCTIICGTIYFAMAFIVAGVAPMAGLEKETAVAMVFTEVGAKWLAIIVFIGGFLGLTTAGYTPFVCQI